MGSSAVVCNVNQVSFRQAITPLEMQSRMNATMRFIVWGTMPIGSVAGGILASFIPLRAPVLVAALITSSAFLWVLFSPVRSLRSIPKAARAETEPVLAGRPVAVMRDPVARPKASGRLAERDLRGGPEPPATAVRTVGTPLHREGHSRQGPYT